MTDLIYDETYWQEPCPKVRCKRPRPEGLGYTSIPSTLGDDSPASPVAPKNGAYSNEIVEYGANGALYIYSAEGVPVKIKEGR